MTTATAIEYEADDRTMIGRLAMPTGEGRHPGVLIAHEGPGLDDHQRARADQLAELGYVAFALDYQGGGKSVTDREAMMARLDALWHDPERTRGLARAGLDILLAQPHADSTQVAAIGYCFGGHLVLELARSGAALAAVVGFHPRLATPRPLDAGNITGKVLVCIGSEDPLISVGERLMFEEQMRAAGVDWRMNLYGGAQHSFTHPQVDRIEIPGLRFDQISAQRSWRAMLDLFDETFTGSPIS
jgi:dienelactone hydrolase